MTLGFLGLILHGHIPWCKKSGTWPAGEEWLFEAMYETYIPLLNVLRDLQEKGIKTAITINITPILAEQLADEYMKQRFTEYMEDMIKRAKSDMQKYDNNPQKKAIAEFHLNNFENVIETFYHNYYRDILGSFKWLEEEGMIELITCGATHGFLPLLESDSGVFSQIQLAIDTHKKYFKRDPKGIWLPECAYRPKELKKGKLREGIDYWLNNSGIQYFFVDSHGILNSELIEQNNRIGLNTTFGFNLETGVSVFGRNKNSSRQVWDSEIGYPGDSYYREFNKKDPDSGLYYWRITSKTTRQEEKQLYDITKAQERVESHANHFISLIIEELMQFSQEYNEKGIIVSPYDFELYGHWWMEGIPWLKRICELISAHDDIKMITFSEYISLNKEKFSIIRMQESSWGMGGHFLVWQNQEHGWIWSYINSSIQNFESVLEINPNPNELEKRVLNQLARELILMEGSDWPFLLYTKQAKEYANQRFHNHHQRFNKLLWAAKNFNDKNRLNLHDLEEMESIDSCFQDINIKYFKKID